MERENFIHICVVQVFALFCSFIYIGYSTLYYLTRISKLLYFANIYIMFVLEMVNNFNYFLLFNWKKRLFFYKELFTRH